VKWIIFTLGLAGIIPLTSWLRQNPHQLPKVWLIIGALPFVMVAFPKHEIAILGDPGWPGFAQGFNISAIDLIILAMYLGLPRGGSALPFKLSFMFYISAVLLSAFHAPSSTATFYYAWQLLRMFMVYIVVARACIDVRLTTSILKGLAFGLCFESCLALWQRFVLHYLHVTGAFEHQNMLGFTTHFIIFPFFALLLAGQKGWQPPAIPLIGLLTDIITASRASIGLAGGGFSILFILSMLRKWTTRKARVLVAAVLVLALLSPLAYRQFELRLAAIGTSTLEEIGSGGRDELNDAARMILSDNPWGIGANNFFVAATTRGYYKRADVSPLSNNLIPHNIYWVTAAETGYVGLLALFIFLIRPLVLALSCGWRNRDVRGDLLLGLATSLIIAYIHSYFEWSFFQDQGQYFFAIEIGIIAGLAEQLGSRTRRSPTAS
jgi:O-antigen ligase